MCAECFASRVEVGNHKSYHPYRFADTVMIPLLSDTWSPTELSQLLEGLEQFGYGNWNDVSRFVDTKGPTECRDAVSNFFVDGCIGRATYDEQLRGNAADHTSSKIQPAQESQSDANDLSVPELMVVGWLPSRDEFEVEHNNEAESLVSSLEVGKYEDGDDEVETALKLAHIEMYQERLKDRDRRRQAVRDYNLVRHFFRDGGSHALAAAAAGKLVGQLKPVKRGGRDSKGELMERLKATARFQTTTAEHAAFVASMLRERELKSRIKELNRYRKNGVHSNREAEQFDAQRVRRNREKAERKRAQESAGFEELSLSRKEISLGTAGSADLDLDSLTTVVGLPGFDMLTSNEKRLCGSLRLHPCLYIAYKTCLLRDHALKRRGQIPRPLHPAGLDKNQRRL